MFSIIAAILGGIAYRIRGGMLDDIIGREIPNNYIRSVWALYVMFMLPLSVWSPVIFALALVGVIPGYFGGKFDLTKRENRTWKNYAWLSLRGAFIMSPLALCFTMLYPWLWLGVLAGALMPMWYWIGIKIPEKKPYVSHSQIGEWFIGLSIGAVLSSLIFYALIA